MKKRGFGAGRWNGFGGKVEDGETIEEAMKREMKEEAGVDIKNFEKVGILNFEFQDGSSPVQVHCFKTEEFIGEPAESEEMKPEWFFVDEIPFAQMWPDDIYWIPMFLKNKKFKGKFIFDRPSSPEYVSLILSKELEEVEYI
ncbi:MAG: 8-oxo-dGTP diphosphatase [Candidatus Pacebacteria bacterium]|nr:8-oxo-dGTP diphosphatase [Candidatus Paceibacterota bacterium]